MIDNFGIVCLFCIFNKYYVCMVIGFIFFEYYFVFFFGLINYCKYIIKVILMFNGLF